MKDGFAGRVTSLIAYLVFSAGSIWGFSESLHMTLAGRLPKPIGYLLGFALVALGSLGLYLIRRAKSEGYVDDRPSSLVGGVCTFLVAAAALAVANSHNVFYLMVAPDVRQADMIRARDAIKQVASATDTEIVAAANRLKLRIAQLTEQLKNEITNEFNPGADVKAAVTLRALSDAIGEPINFLSGRPSNRRGAFDYAQRMAEHVQQVGNGKVQRFIDVRANFAARQRDLLVNQVVDRLTNASTDISVLDSTKDSTDLLRQAHSTLGALQNAATQALQDPDIKRYAVALPAVASAEAVSEQLAFAPYVVSAFLKSTLPAPLPSKFLWAFFIGVTLDFGAFMFWFFGVLRRTNE